MMALDVSGQDEMLNGGRVSIDISQTHPLVLLSNSLPWQPLIALVMADLKATTCKGCWWMGRRLLVRMHLGAYLLQRIYNLSDRKLEYQIKDNAAYQLFCGSTIVDDWHAPDHTKIENFRNRLSPETQRLIANEMAKIAVQLGFGDPREVDFDSTVQEAGIAYPSDAALMTKLAGMGKKVALFLAKKFKHLLPSVPSIDIGSIKKQAREYFFLSKNKPIEVKRAFFKKLHLLVKRQMRPFITLCEQLPERNIAELPWNVRRSFDQIRKDGWRYLLDVAHFTRTHTIKTGKVLSFHAKDLACIKKGKLGKPYEFGRVFQLGRIKGNFLFVLESTSIFMNDKENFQPLLSEHAELFGEACLETVAVDKGYWSGKNCRALTALGVATEGLQRPSNVKDPSNEIPNLKERLRNRRAGIEPLIGHAKHGGQLGRSRMNSDTATLAAGYGSICGLNLRQLIRRQQEKIKSAA